MELTEEPSKLCFDNYFGWSLVNEIMPLEAVQAVPDGLISTMSSEVKAALDRKYQESEDKVHLASYVQELKEKEKFLKIEMEDFQKGFGVSTQKAIAENSPVTVYLGSLLFTDFLSMDQDDEVDNRILVYNLRFSKPDDLAHSLTHLLIEKELKKRKLNLTRKKRNNLIENFLVTFKERHVEDHIYALESLSYSFEIIKSKEFLLAVSAAYEGTTARYINHSKSPNCKARIRWHELEREGLQAWPFVEFYAKRDIAPEEFLSVSYGKETEKIFATHEFISRTMDEVFDSLETGNILSQQEFKGRL